jgi:RimJ/RimL family protein N-acetyltransferase
MPFEFRPLKRAEAVCIVNWRYETPYDFYNPAAEALEPMLDARHGYFAAFKDGQLVGFCCFGPDAQVAGGEYGKVALDIGAGLRPDMTGQGIGRAFLTAVVTFSRECSLDRPLRATVAAFNARAIRVVQSVGFTEVTRFRRPLGGVEFVILERAGERET